MIDPNTTFSLVTAPERRSLHWKQSRIPWADVVGWLDEPGEEKEAGNYVFGTLRQTTVEHKSGKTCTNLHRRKGAILTRSMLTLDIDHPYDSNFPSTVEMLLGCAAIVHTTYSSTPEQPRYRLLIPSDREMAADEYWLAAAAVMEKLGIEQFDPSCVQAERYMFLPAAQQPEWFESYVFDGDPIRVDDLIQMETDLSKLPPPRVHRNKRNPYEIEGAIGAFNRAYEDLALLVESYDLPYERIDEDRWHLIGARAEAGMGPIRGAQGLYFSHHVSDPAYGKTCSSFDLVRLHRYWELDEDVPDSMPVNRRPSHHAMLELASTDHRVVAEMVGIDFNDDPDGEDFLKDEWKLGLAMHPRTGYMRDTIGNWDLLAQHEDPFPALYYNEFSMAVEVDRDLPWRELRKGGPVFTTIDRSALCLRIERDYGIRPPRSLIDEVINSTAQQRFVNPVHDYLNPLVWDGEPRIETCLPGVEPTEYSRMVARKSLVAAVARIFQPGIKWDHTTILYGREGLGKSWWINTMSKGYSATLGRIGDKDTLITMQRSWIMVSDEGHSLKKADHDAQKEFLTRTEDIFRMPYDRESQVHKRHCVIWGTTNDEVFLRRQEGNRRFLIVRCENRVDFDLYTEEYVDQIWAEAVHLYRQGEILYLGEDEAAVAAYEREQFTEEDALAGVIEDYLETLVPEEWDDMSPEARWLWLRNRADRIVPEGTKRQDTVCSAQLWVEALGRRIGEHRRTDLLEINTVLKRIPGWVAVPGRKRVPHYGPQLVFERMASKAPIDWTII